MLENQYQINYFNQSQQEQTVRWTNQNLLKARETESRVGGAIGFASYWLINWRDIFEPTTKRSHYNGAMTIGNILKTALSFDGEIEDETWKFS